jgi:DNA-binding MarR family transcriptional regulator
VGAAPPDALRGDIGHLLRRAYAQFTAEAAGDGPDSPRSREFVVLDALAGGDARSQQDLAERLGINRTIMVRLVDRLQAAGFLTRARNPANRRSYVLALTAAGRAELAGMRRTMSERDARATARLSTSERRRFDELLAKLLPESEQLTVHSTEYLVTQAHLLMRRIGDEALSDVGLRARHFGALFAIDRFGPCPQQQLARYLAITEPAAAEVVDELVRAGLVVRGQDRQDRRRYALELSDLGRERMTGVQAAVDRMRATIRDTLGADAEAELRRLLFRLLPDGMQEATDAAE